MSYPMSSASSSFQPVYKAVESRTKEKRYLHQLESLHAQVLTGKTDYKTTAQTVKRTTELVVPLIKALGAQEASQFGKTVQKMNEKLLRVLEKDTSPAAKILVGQIKNVDEQIAAEILQKDAEAKKGFMRKLAPSIVKKGADFVKKGAEKTLQGTVNLAIWSVGEEELVKSYVLPTLSVKNMTGQTTLAKLVDSYVQSGGVPRAFKFDKRLIDTLQTNLGPSLDEKNFQRLIAILFETASDSIDGLNILSQMTKTEVQKQERILTSFVELMTGRSGVSKDDYEQETRKRVLANIKRINADPNLSEEGSKIATKVLLQLPFALGCALFGDDYLVWAQEQMGKLLGTATSGGWINMGAHEGDELRNNAMEIVFLNLADKIFQEIVTTAREQKDGVIDVTRSGEDTKKRVNNAFDDLVHDLINFANHNVFDEESITKTGLMRLALKLGEGVITGRDASILLVEPIRRETKQWVTSIPESYLMSHDQAQQKLIEETEEEEVKAIFYELPGENGRPSGERYVLMQSVDDEEGPLISGPLLIPDGKSFEEVCREAGLGSITAETLI